MCSILFLAQTLINLILVSPSLSTPEQSPQHLERCVPPVNPHRLSVWTTLPALCTYPLTHRPDRRRRSATPRTRWPLDGFVCPHPIRWDNWPVKILSSSYRSPHCSQVRRNDPIHPTHQDRAVVPFRVASASLSRLLSLSFLSLPYLSL